MKKNIFLVGFLNLALVSMAQNCIDTAPPGIELPPANTKAFWNWKGDDATKFDGTGNFFFRQEFGNNIGLVTQYSPYSAGNNQPNTSQFTNIPIDFEESDGWELAYRYFGEIQPCAASSTNTPFFALYNRNTGVLRIFVTLTSNPSGNGAAISLSGSTDFKNSAALSYGDEVIAPLEIFNVHPGELKFVNQAISCGAGNNCKTWYYGDFKIFYDPCICQNKVSWNIRFDLITSQQISWETNGTEEQILGPGASGTKKNSLLSIAQGVSGAATGAIKAGKQGYKQGESFESDANNWIQENNECFWANGDDLLSKSGVSKLTSLLSLAPGVGAAFSAVSFLSTAFGFLKKDQGTIVTPYRSKIKQTSEGYITSGTNPLNQVFKLPGSYKQEKNECIDGIRSGPLIEDFSLSKPIYDRPLGVVSLITPVKMEYVEYNSDPVIRKITTWPFGGYSDERVTPNPVREYRLSNDLKFAINPASDLEIENIEAEFNFDFPNMPSDNCVNVGHRFALSDFGPFSVGMLKPFGPYYLVEEPGKGYDPMLNCDNSGRELLKSKKWYEGAGFEIFSASNRVVCAPSFENEPEYERVRLKDIVFKSPTVPIQLLRAMTFKVFHDGPNPFRSIKFIIFLKHKTSGKKFLEIVSYQVRSEDFIRSGLDPFNLKYSSGRYKSACEPQGGGTIPQNVSIWQHYPQSIDPSPFTNSLSGVPSQLSFSNEIVSSSQTAIFEVNIGDGTIFQQSGNNNIVIRALNINVAPEVEIPPFVTLIEDLSEWYSSASNIATTDEIKSVCMSNDYVNRANLRKAFSSDPVNPDQNMVTFTTLGYPVPNPTNSKCQISFDLAEPSGYEMHISNAMGVNVMQLETRDFASSGKYSVNFSTERLEAGVYYISFSSDGFRQARKLVVVK